MENAAAAADVLAWYSNSTAAGHSKALRVWDLQRLQSYDKLRQQKQAQAQFPSGGSHVIVHVTLMQCLAHVVVYLLAYSTSGGAFLTLMYCLACV